MIQVAVCGPREASEPDLRNAGAVGALLAERGAAVICGGYGGVMDAVAQGARQAGGLVIGVLSGHDRTGASPHLTIAIPTGLAEARNAIIALAGDVIVVVGGSWGTLSELALAMRAGKTVIQLGGWRITDPAGDPIPGVLHANTPEQVIELAGL